LDLVGQFFIQEVLLFGALLRLQKIKPLKKSLEATQMDAVVHL